MANMMREPHLDIAVKTDFYASEKIPLAIKEFYRKSKNNFLLMAVVQKRTFEAYKERKAQL